MMRWNGSSSHYEIIFELLNARGEVTFGPIGASNSTGHAYHPDLAWNGSKYAVVWADGRNGGYFDIYATLLNANGTVFSSDIAITNAAQ